MKSVSDQWGRLGIGQLACHGSTRLGRQTQLRPDMRLSLRGTTLWWYPELRDTGIVSETFPRRYRPIRRCSPSPGPHTARIGSPRYASLVYMGLIRTVTMRNISCNIFPLYLHPASMKKNADIFLFYFSPRERGMNRVVSHCIGYRYASRRKIEKAWRISPYRRRHIGMSQFRIVQLRSMWHRSPFAL